MKSFIEISNRELIGVLVFATAFTALMAITVKNLKKQTEEKSGFGLTSMQEKFNEQNASALQKIQDAWDEQMM